MPQLGLSGGSNCSLGTLAKSKGLSGLFICQVRPSAPQPRAGPATRKTEVGVPTQGRHHQGLGTRFSWGLGAVKG